MLEKIYTRAKSMLKCVYKNWKSIGLIIFQKLTFKAHICVF